ncbi:hypothetical protein C487_05294, partial [Natrinema pallidum DSM 3751]
MPAYSLARDSWLAVKISVNPALARAVGTRRARVLLVRFVGGSVRPVGGDFAAEFDRVVLGVRRVGLGRRVLAVSVGRLGGVLGGFVPVPCLLYTSLMAR